MQGINDSNNIDNEIITKVEVEIITKEEDILYDYEVIDETNKFNKNIVLKDNQGNKDNEDNKGNDDLQNELPTRFNFKVFCINMFIKIKDYICCCSGPDFS